MAMESSLSLVNSVNHHLNLNLILAGRSNATASTSSQHQMQTCVQAAGSEHELAPPARPALAANVFATMDRAPQLQHASNSRPAQPLLMQLVQPPPMVPTAPHVTSRSTEAVARQLLQAGDQGALHSTELAGAQQPQHVPPVRRAQPARSCTRSRGKPERRVGS